MKNLEGIVGLADKEMGAILENGKFRSREEIDSVYKLVDIVKDAYCIWSYEDDEEYSERYMPYEGSYRGRRNAKRDRMGRYSKNDEYMDKLHDLMEHAPDDATRQSIQRMIDSM